MRRVIVTVLLLILPISLVRAQGLALSVNPSSREEVRQFYRSVYFASENVPMGWTGNYETGAAGDTSAAFKEATRLRINFYRALVGVPADIAFNAAYSGKAQQAALLMSVNNDLSHTPPPTWRLYNATAAEAARNSNLALGQAGPDAITGYVADAGDNNAVVGHRRWIFYPQTLQMGTGDVPGLPNSDTIRPANAVWVLDTTPGGEFGARRPTTRTTAVPYPPAGFVPYPLVWPRWSFSYPGADFSAATVTMTRNGQNVPTKLEPLSNEVGEPTLVWVYDNRDSSSATPHAKPAADTTYAVSVSNVRVGNAAQNFSYTVTVFDPDVAGSDFAAVSISGNALPAAGSATTYTLTKPSFANAFDWRTLQLLPITRSFTAEAGLEGLLATTSVDYETVQAISAASGSRSYRLAHSAARTDQVLRVPGFYLVSGEAATLSFNSRLAIATDTEIARVQVSTDDGMSWVDVFTQRGSSATSTNTPAPTDATFVTRSIPLGAFRGRTIAIRFAYSIGMGSAFVPSPTNTVGWFVDDIVLSNVEEVTAGTPTRVATGNTFSFTPTSAGSTALQARGVMFATFPLEWGQVLPVNVVTSGAATSTSYLSNLSVRTAAGSGGQTLIAGFAITGGTKPLLVRGIGPTLASFGVTTALNDPKLELYRDATKISENDNWIANDATSFTSVGAFALPNGSRDSAIVMSLPSGSYTAQVSGVSGATGTALLELYDAAGSGLGAKLSNVSARSQVGGASGTLIAGFTISGTGTRTLLIRAVGPTLGGFGVPDALSDPRLQLFGGSGLIQENDDWDTGTRSTFARVGAFDLASGSRDAVLVVTLPPGSYTAQVTGAGNASGIALVEVYDVP